MLYDEKGYKGKGIEGEYMARKRETDRPKSQAYLRRCRVVYRNRAILAVIAVAIIGICIGGIKRKFGKEDISGTFKSVSLTSSKTDWRGAPPLDVQLLTPNPYSRPQLKLEQVKGIVIHYTANPGTSAQANRDYFEGLKDGQGTSASSHFIVGLEGEIIQCVPTAEEAYASNNRNVDTLSIECCHPDESGQFKDVTYQSVIQLTGWLCVRYDLSPEDVIRHHDVTGKECPKYFVDHEDAWEQFRADVKDKIEEIKKEQS